MRDSDVLRRGNIVWLRMHPQAGHEQSGYRPALVLSDGYIDYPRSSLAFVVPITNRAKGYPFEVPIPEGIDINTVGDPSSFLTGVVLTDRGKSLDMRARDAKVIGQVDVESPFFLKVITYVRSILA